MGRPRRGPHVCCRGLPSYSGTSGSMVSWGRSSRPGWGASLRAQVVGEGCDLRAKVVLPSSRGQPRASFRWLSPRPRRGRLLRLVILVLLPPHCPCAAVRPMTRARAATPLPSGRGKGGRGRGPPPRRHAQNKCLTQAGIATSHAPSLTPSRFSPLRGSMLLFLIGNAIVCAIGRRE